MISRGEVGLIVATYGLTHEVITKDVFSVMVLMVLVTTMITPIWLRYVFPRVEEVRAAVPESIAHLEGRPPSGG
jgi:Kef-type K+ transport system membrane component KefB